MDKSQAGKFRMVCLYLKVVTGIAESYNVL